MKRKAFEYGRGIILQALILLAAFSGKAQVVPAAPLPPQEPSIPEKNFQFNEKLQGLNDQLRELNLLCKEKTFAALDKQLKNLDVQLKGLENNLSNTFESLGENLERSYPAQLAEKTKTISRSYKVNSKDKLAIDNQYGNVTINTWPKNEIKVDIVIRAFENTEDGAQALLEGVNIQESRQGSTISFKTSIERGKSIWRLIPSGGRDKRGVQVDYEIYMPSRNPLDISNKYGNITVPDFAGRLNINSSYGSFSAKELSGPENSIASRYGSVSIEGLKSGNVNVRYGSLDIDDAQSLQADVSYASIKIGRLSGSSALDIKYCGKCRINEIDRSLKGLDINASYSSLALGFAPSASFNFDVSVNYAGFKFNDSKVNITSKTPDDSAKGFHPAKNYKGRYGSGSGPALKIVSNYGSVQFL